MITKQEVESINKEIKTVSRAIVAVNRQIAYLSDGQRTNGRLTGASRRQESDYVSNTVVTLQELKETLHELNENKRAISLHAEAIREELKHCYHDNPLLVLAIDYHYLRGMTWNATAKTIGIPYRTCLRMCTEALKMLGANEPMDKPVGELESQKYSSELTRMAEFDMQM